MSAGLRTMVTFSRLKAVYAAAVLNHLESTIEPRAPMADPTNYATADQAAPGAQAPRPEDIPAAVPPPERGGPKGPEPTRYGDWEKKGRCIDF